MIPAVTRLLEHLTDSVIIIPIVFSGDYCGIAGSTLRPHLPQLVLLSTLLKMSFKEIPYLEAKSNVSDPSYIVTAIQITVEPSQVFKSMK